MTTGAKLRTGLAVALLILGLSGIAVAWAEDSDCQPRIVAAFDIGSGTMRMQVADIAACLELESKTLLRQETAISFAADLAERSGDRFSAEIMQRSTTEVAAMLDAARAAGAEEWFGVATAAFRRSVNGPELLIEWQKRFGLQVDIITQHEEGRLAYRLIEAGGVASEPLVVWDIGAGSQQIVWREPESGSFKHFNSSLASVTFRNLAMAELDRPASASSPNPVTLNEAERLAELVRERTLSEVPTGLIALIENGARVVGVGGVHGASLISQAGLRPGDELTRSLLSEVLETRLGRDDTAIGGAYADTEVTNLILVLELMAIYGIDAYQATRADLTDALLFQAAERPSPVVPEP